MKWVDSILFFVFSFLLPLSLNAQDSLKAELEIQIEKAFEESDPEQAGIEDIGLLQFLEDLAASPVSLNTASIDDLLQIPGMNIVLARAVIEYRELKPFENIEELRRVKGIGEVTYKRVQPYVTIGTRSDRFKGLYKRPEYWLSGNRIEVLSRMQQNLEDQEGFIRADSSGGYLGNAVKYYQRFKLRSDHLSLNLTQEKDAGETLSGPTGFDFISWHIALTQNGKLKNVIIGDYSIGFGQGLVIWTGGVFGKGRYVTGTINKNERGVRPYSSAQETEYFRGFAVTYGDKLEMTVFHSNRPRTASIVDGDTTRFPSSSGFHRTQSEIERRNNINQITTGGRFQLDTKLGLFGTTGYISEFSSYIKPASSVSNAFKFEGIQSSTLGVDYRGLIGNSLVFGEAARSQNGGIGAIFGLETSINDQTDIALLYRNYSRDFQSFMGDGFGESSGYPQNERGLYLGVRQSLSSKYALSTYFDQYFFDAPRFGTTQPTQGYDLLGLIEGELTPSLDVYILVRNEIQDDEYSFLSSIGREELGLSKKKRQSLRFQSEYKVNRRTRLRSRVELVRNRNAGQDWESGMLLYQDIRVRLGGKIQVDGRVTIFDTDSYDTRLYQFENDLLYVLSNVGLSDKGQRSYLVVKYSVSKFLQLWVKYSVTRIEDAQVLSSGLGEIQGDRRSFIGLQARLLIR